MRRDKNAPALYELIRDRSQLAPVRQPAAPASPGAPMPPAPPTSAPSRAAQRPPQTSEPEPAATASSAMGVPSATVVGPGRAVRIPMGYFLPALLCVAIVVVGAYVAGYAVREGEEAEREKRESAVALDAVDPLVSGGPAPGVPSVIRPNPANAAAGTQPQPAPVSKPPATKPAPSKPAASNPAPAKTAPTIAPSVPAAGDASAPRPQNPAPAGPAGGNPAVPARQPTRPAGSENPAVPAESGAPKPEQTPAAKPETKPDAKPAEPAKPRYVVVSKPADDPRQPGLNYLIAATLDRADAEGAASFLSERGLEIAVVPVDNRGSQWWVIVLSGVEGKDLSSARAKGLETRLEQLGRIYKDDFKGPTTFNEPWWKKYSKDAPARASDEE